jgi:AMP-binding enzyme C-terminal domain/Thioesterase domain
VELGEVETWLRRHPAVSNAAVVMQKSDIDERSTVGFVAADKATVTTAELRNHLAATLPSYMIPSRLVITPRLPTMPSGKIDRGPYAVAGFSAGGVAAMAVAEELRALGESTDFVGLIDSVTPLSVSVPSPFTTPRRLVRFSRALVGRAWEVLNRPRPLRRARLAILRSLTRWDILEREHSFDEMFPDAGAPRGRMKSTSTRGSTNKRSGATSSAGCRSIWCCFALR